MSKEEKIRKILEIERSFKEKISKRENTVWRFINSLHSIPQLREWITLESTPLLPFVEKKGSNLKFYILLTTLTKNKTVNKPWGLAIITWPEKRVIVTKNSLNWDMDIKLRIGHICNKAYADLIQEAYNDNNKLPLPPKELLSVYLKNKVSHQD